MASGLASDRVRLERGLAASEATLKVFRNELAESDAALGRAEAQLVNQVFFTLFSLIKHDTVSRPEHLICY